MNHKDDDSTKNKKKERNRILYLRNRSTFLQRAKQRYWAQKVPPAQEAPLPGKVVSIVPRLPQKRRTPNRWRLSKVRLPNFEKSFLLLVIILSTYFLLRETVAFLIQTEGDPTSAWLKACVGEGIALAVAWARVPSLTGKVGKVTLLFLLFCYNAVAVVGGVWTQGQMKIAEASISRQTVSELEETIREKQAVRLRYVTEGSDSLARKYDRQIDQLRGELKQARAEMLKNPEAENVRILFSALAFFRLIVMLANYFLVSYFSAFFSKRPAPGVDLQEG